MFSIKLRKDTELAHNLEILHIVQIDITWKIERNVKYI